MSQQTSHVEPVKKCLPSAKKDERPRIGTRDRPNKHTKQASCDTLHLSTTSAICSNYSSALRDEGAVFTNINIGVECRIASTTRAPSGPFVVLATWKFIWTTTLPVTGPLRMHQCLRGSTASRACAWDAESFSHSRKKYLRK